MHRVKVYDRLHPSVHILATNEKWVRNLENLFSWYSLSETKLSSKDLHQALVEKKYLQYVPNQFDGQQLPIDTIVMVYEKEHADHGTMGQVKRYIRKSFYRVLLITHEAGLHEKDFLRRQLISLEP